MSKSRIERLYECLCNGETADIEPESRVEKYLLAMICGETVEDVPKSRVEAYLAAICQNGGAGGKLPQNAGIYYFGNAINSGEKSILDFETGAVGALEG